MTPEQSALIERLLNADQGARQEAAAEIRRLAEEVACLRMAIEDVLPRHNPYGHSYRILSRALLPHISPERAKPTDQEEKP